MAAISPANVVDVYDLKPLRCKKCELVKEQSQFKELRYYVPMRRGRCVRMLHPHCDDCRTKSKARWAGAKCYNARADEYLRRLVSRQRSSAQARGIAFMLEPEDVIDAYVSQDGKCALSGMSMMVEEGFVGARNYYAASIDRIDSKGNYAIGNAQLVCAGVNLIKGNMSDMQFVQFCKRVVEHHADKQDELERLCSGISLDTPVPNH